MTDRRTLLRLPLLLALPAEQTDTTLYVTSLIEDAAAWEGIPQAASHLCRIASCESGMDPEAKSANGLYWGLFQFSLTTWAYASDTAGWGGFSRLDPVASAYTAAWLYRTSGPQHWPACRWR